jgi:hypothetical protein
VNVVVWGWIEGMEVLGFELGRKWEFLENKGKAIKG